MRATFFGLISIVSFTICLQNLEATLPERRKIFPQQGPLTLRKCIAYVSGVAAFVSIGGVVHQVWFDKAPQVTVVIGQNGEKVLVEKVDPQTGTFIPVHPRGWPELPSTFAIKRYGKEDEDRYEIVSKGGESYALVEQTGRSLLKPKSTYRIHNSTGTLVTGTKDIMSVGTSITFKDSNGDIIGTSSYATSTSVWQGNSHYVVKDTEDRPIGKIIFTTDEAGARKFEFFSVVNEQATAVAVATQKAWPESADWSVELIDPKAFDARIIAAFIIFGWKF